MTAWFLAVSATTAWAQDDVHSQLYDTLEAGLDQSVVIDRAIDATVEQLAKTNPALRQAEAKAPGMIRAMADEMRPTLSAYAERVRQQYRPRMVAAVREVLDEREAAALSSFYGSPLGRRVLAAVSGNFAISNVSGEMLQGKPASTESVRRDLAETVKQGLAALSAEDREEVAKQVLTTPGLVKMATLNQRIIAIRAEMERTPPNNQEMAAVVDAARRVARRYGL